MCVVVCVSSAKPTRERSVLLVNVARYTAAGGMKPVRMKINVSVVPAFSVGLDKQPCDCSKVFPPSSRAENLSPFPSM